MHRILLTLSIIPSLILAADFRKTPSLYLTGKSNEMKVVWQLDSAPTGSISFFYATGGQKKLLTPMIKDITPTSSDHLYEYVMTGSHVDHPCNYWIQVDERKATGSFLFPPPSDDNTLSFYALGDGRSHPDVVANVIAAMQKDMEGHPERQTFVLHSGDWVDKGNEEAAWDAEWFRPDERQIAARAVIPFMGTQGNHDRGELFRKYLRMNFPASPATYNAFTYGPVRVITLDLGSWLRAGDRQYNWMTNELATHSNKHFVFCFHEPGWSSGHHVNDRTVQRVVQPALEHYGVQLVVCGHNHNYTHAVTNGVHHVTSGGAGAPLRAGNTNSPGVVATEMAHHFLRIDINGSTGTVTAFRTNRTVIESFSFVKPVTQYPLATMELPPEEPIPALTVPMASKTKARGRPGKVNWKEATNIVIAVDTWGLPFPNRKSSVRMIHDGKYLYLRLTEPGDYRKRSNAGYSGDRWELFFAPNRSEPYRQLAIMPDGDPDFHAMGEPANTNGWHESTVIKLAKRNHKEWDLQLSIPLSTFSAAGVKAGDTVFMNIIRGAPGDRDSTCWSPLYSDSYHNILRLGAVTLGATP